MANAKLNRTVLIVDDEPDLRDLLVSAFQDAGFRTVEAENGAHAYQVLLREKPDAVVSDVRMRGGGGLELLSKSKKQYPEVPVFLISGYSDTSASQATELGADSLIIKPFSPDKIAIQVLEFINKQRNPT